MDATKIMLSADELQLVQNSHWILTKNGIIEKVYGMFGNIAGQLQHHVHAQARLLPEDVIKHAPKIARGEKYEDLPYVMLDYPRLFGKDDIAAVRNFFWWGRFFSTTLHVRGRHREALAQNLLANFDTLSGKGWSITTGINEWTHNVDNADYTLLSGYSKTTLSDFLEKSDFIKLAVKVPLKDWDLAEKHLGTCSIEMISLLGQKK